jgi:hypothetical protein
MADLSTPNPGGPAVTDDYGQATGIENPLATPGEDNALICDRTGFRVRVSEGLKKEWTGNYVRAESWEPRHPLDLLRARTTERGGGSIRPEPADVFLGSDATPATTAYALTDENGTALTDENGTNLEYA